MSLIGIVDYDCGNIKSLANAIKFLGYEFKLIEKKEELSQFQKIILPGVGAFDHAIESLHKKDLFVAIQEWSNNDSNKLLGICLGMQLLCKDSEESLKNNKGLNLIDANVMSLSDKLKSNDKVPHMGWNEINLIENKTFNNENDKRDFYFVHSYAVFVNNEKFSLAKTDHGDSSFDSMIFNGQNVFGAQFHPEKSHHQGLNLVKNFIDNA